MKKENTTFLDGQTERYIDVKMLLSLDAYKLYGNENSQAKTNYEI